MNDFIERYIYDVIRRLPENQRDEVKKELRANIEDMLPKNYEKEDIIKVFEALGEPRVLASSYRVKQRYLISPIWMDDYLRVLKVVMIIFGTLGLVFGIIDLFFNEESLSVVNVLGDVFEKALGGMIDGLLTSFAIVTLIFVGIEHADVKKTLPKFNLKDLPKLPKDNQAKISRSGSIIGLVFTIFFGLMFLYAFINNQLIFGWYEEGVNLVLVEPLFTDSVIQSFVPAFFMLILLTVISYCIKIYYGRINYVVSSVHTLDKIVSLIVFIVFTQTTNLLSPEFLLKAADYFNTTSSTITDGFRNATTGIAVLIALGTSIELIFLWIKTLKQDSKCLKQKKVK